jgi:hypothetical protein
MTKSKFQLTATFVFAVIILLIYGCNTRSVSLDLLIPGEITIPQDIQSVGILNRSLPEKNDQLINILEGFITGESVLADREGSFNCIHGVETKLRESPRLQAMSIETDQYRGTGTRLFPEVLNWQNVDAICKQYHVDGLLVLETFDSDFELKKHTSETTEKVNGREVKKTVHHADLRVNVNTGWRFYDNIHKQIIDKVTYTDRKDWDGSGSSEKAAIEDLPSKRLAINEAGRFAGLRIADRISPHWRTETRKYFVKGNKEFIEAKEQVKFNNWEPAIEIWKRLAESHDPEIAGKACYNMALASEMKGNIDLALTWAEKSMKVYHIKKARSYVEILKRRQYNEQRLKEQMN